MGLGLWLGLFLGVPTSEGEQQDDRVVLTIAVTDNKEHNIDGLQPKDFRIWEDGIVQKIDTFAENEKFYRVTYLPAQNPNEGFRKIEVRIVSADLGKYRVHHRPGYRPRRVEKN